MGLLYIDGPKVDGTKYGNLERFHVNSSSAVTGIQEQETTVNVDFDIHVPGYGLQETDYYHAVEEKFGEQNFRVFSEMRGKFLYIDPSKSKTWDKI